MLPWICLKQHFEFSSRVGHITSTTVSYSFSMELQVSLGLCPSPQLAVHIANIRYHWGPSALTIWAGAWAALSCLLRQLVGCSGRMPVPPPWQNCQLSEEAGTGSQSSCLDWHSVWAEGLWQFMAMGKCSSWSEEVGSQGRLWCCTEEVRHMKHPALFSCIYLLDRHG